jgi:hypothetical protein
MAAVSLAFRNATDAFASVEAFSSGSMHRSARECVVVRIIGIHRVARRCEPLVHAGPARADWGDGVEAGDLLDGWLAHPALPHRRSKPLAGPPEGPRAAGLRFAFYGRISTAGYQDAASSRRWQRDCAEELIDGRGLIVADFFDAGVSRRSAWADRPQAAALLAAAAVEADRGFDAIVVGECERALYGDRLTELLPVLAEHGVAVWLPR